MTQRYYTETDQAKAFKALLLQLEERLNLTRSVNVYLAGGMAIHLYTQNRTTMDVDAEFDARIAIPNEQIARPSFRRTSRNAWVAGVYYRPRGGNRRTVTLQTRIAGTMMRAKPRGDHGAPEL